MLKKTIRYEDLNGKVVEEDFYFNLSQTELMHMYINGGENFVDKVRNIIRARDNIAIVKLLEDIVLMSYGQKSDDGKRFIKKNGELAKEFVESPAYDALYFELMSNPDSFGDFINRLVPPDLAEKVAKMQAKGELPKSLLAADTPEKDIINAAAVPAVM